MRPTALVTGAARGIGARAAQRLAADAWDVVAVDTDEPGLARTALRSPNTHTRTCDVTDPKAVAAVLAVTGPVNRLVCAPAAPSTELEHVLRMDVLGASHLIEAALPGMLDRGRGEIIVLTESPSRSPAHAAASAAVAAYLRALATDHPAPGVRFRHAAAHPDVPHRVVLDAVDRSLARRTRARTVHPARRSRLLPHS
ncbi:SDR family NAD(P)-dependent oxidoreductase [Actinomadura algeriensis]|uniref:NAD(P)-dependent dehydrogenase (Short-subunit alcohol dehydrogenase family) n=1 Tax=Actinomadura algeriensis TaxID=1679523 RepID=A0ABR9JTE8_9ACTN|nr:SDR family NAD(P)-dependent oxidoreductase [Actinomadura algeriensis]MBE1533773.1 NAD(P)-dependent dehydrogenase (short-subunit alcohol dehydrogenase family) [Actinomadura algeriensis]